MIFWHPLTCPHPLYCYIKHDNGLCTDYAMTKKLALIVIPEDLIHAIQILMILVYFRYDYEHFYFIKKKIQY